MKFSRAIFVVAVVIMAASGVWAQDAITSQTPLPSFSGAPRASDLSAPTSGLGFSLLDPSRLRISHSYSMSYMTGSGYSSSVGLYMSTLEYQFAKPLSVRVGLGYLHQPLGFTGVSGPDGEFLPNVRLDWRPSDNMHFIIDYRTISTSLDPNYGFGYRSPYYRSMNPLWDW